MDNTILQSVIGLTIVILGSQLAIFSATSITKAFKLSTGIISILFLGAGTSLPELASTISLAIQKKPALITPNIIGSNVCNILLCLGCAALFAEIKAESSENRYSSVVAAIVAAVSALLLYFGQFNKIIAVVSCAIFIAYLWSIRPKNQTATEQNQINLLEPIHKKTKASLMTNIFLLLVSLLGLSYGSEIFVRSISIFAFTHNLTDTATGLVFIATGTSLPELAISIMAAIKKEYDIVYGNILGSNIFNTLVILSVGMLISKEPIPQPSLLLLVASIVVAIATMIVVLKNKAIKRVAGISMIIAYFALSAYYL